MRMASHLRLRSRSLRRHAHKPAARKPVQPHSRRNGQPPHFAWAVPGCLAKGMVVATTPSQGEVAGRLTRVWASNDWQHDGSG